MCMLRERLWQRVQTKKDEVGGVGYGAGEVGGEGKFVAASDENMEVGMGFEQVADIALHLEFCAVDGGGEHGGGGVVTEEGGVVLGGRDERKPCGVFVHGGEAQLYTGGD